MKAGRDRAKRLERIARAQAAVAQAERARHAVAEYQRVRCAETAEALVASLSGDTPLHGVMIPAMARMLQANAREATILEAAAEQARQSERLERLRAERIAERAHEARRVANRVLEAQRLERLSVSAVVAGNDLVEEYQPES